MMLDDILAARFDLASDSGSESNSKEERVIALVKRLVEFNGLDQ